MAFILDQNLVRLQTTAIAGRSGRILFSTALPKSVIDTRMAAELGAPGKGYVVTMSEKHTLTLTPAVTDLGNAADAILASDIIGTKAVTIDYATGMVTYQTRGIFTGLMTLYPFQGPPQVTVSVNGQTYQAIVDTASPDTLVLPGKPGRTNADISLAGATFNGVDIRLDDVTEARIGNRLLANFLVSIDYGKHVVGLFHDPRTAAFVRPQIEPALPAAATTAKPATGR